jgi:hypothetical protein
MCFVSYLDMFSIFVYDYFCYAKVKRLNINTLVKVRLENLNLYTLAEK